jgi:hypothetical protein
MIEHFPINPALLLSTTKSRVNCLRGWLRRLPLPLDFRLRTFLVPSATLAGSLLSPVLSFVGRSIYSASSRAVYNRPTEPLSTQPRRASRPPSPQLPPSPRLAPQPQNPPKP